MTLSEKAIEDASRRLRAFLSPTQLVPSKGRTGVSLKLELNQPTGSFKVRPAFNSILAHESEARSRGVIASSSGNFAQAVAFAASKLGIQAQIVMPSNTSPFKVERTRQLGGQNTQVVLSGPSFDERWALTERLQRQSGALMLHPYDSVETIAGDATVGLELLEKIPGDFAVTVPTSGGGLLAGIARVIKVRRPGCRIIGVQPTANGSMLKSFEAGSRVKVPPFVTRADALVAATPGENTFPLVCQHVDAMVGVSEDSLWEAVRFLYRSEGLVVEPGGAAAVAALLEGGLDVQGLPLVCVLSGGNISPQAHAQILEFTS